MNNLDASLRDTPPSENERVTAAAGVVGSATLISRILGAVRDIIIASFFGAGLASDAFIAAFRIPNMVRRMFGEGSMNIAFVPVFTDCLIHHGRAEADRLATSGLRLLTLVLLLVSMIAIVLAPWLVHLTAPGFAKLAPKFALTVHLTRIMIPYILFIGLVALCMGILNVFGHFAAPALAPACLNVAMIAAVTIAGLFISSETVLIKWLALGVLMGGVLQLGLQVPFLIQYKVAFWRSTQLWHPDIKPILLMMGPALFGAAVYQINSLVMTLLGSLLPQGSISYLYYADRLVQFPLGIFAIAMATAVLPSLARQASARQWQALHSTFAHAIRLVFFITIPSMVGLIVLRQPIVALLFQRGAFDAQAVRLTASALLYYGIGLWAFAAVRIVLNTFYALKDTRTPVRMAVLSIGANVILGLALMGPMQHNGLALALSMASMLHLVLLTVALRKKLGPLGWRSIAVSLARSALCAAIMGLCVWHLAGWLLPDGGHHRIGLPAGLAVCIIGGVAVFGALAHGLQVPELKSVMHMVTKRNNLK